MASPRKDLLGGFVKVSNRTTHRQQLDQVVTTIAADRKARLQLVKVTEVEPSQKTCKIVLSAEGREFGRELVRAMSLN